MSLLLFGNQQQIGSGEAGDHHLGPVSVLVTSLQSHQPFLKSKTRREILKGRRRNKRLFDIFQMKGQGRALRAMRQGSRPLASACRADLCGPPGGSSQELGGGGDVTFSGTESRLMGVRAGRAFCTQGRSVFLPHGCMRCPRAGSYHRLHLHPRQTSLGALCAPPWGVPDLGHLGPSAPRI